MESADERTVILRDASGQFYCRCHARHAWRHAEPQRRDVVLRHVRRQRRLEVGTGPMGRQHRTRHHAGLQGADVEALAFIVLMDASRDAQSDLQRIMAGVKSINSQKQAWSATLG